MCAFGGGVVCIYSSDDIDSSERTHTNSVGAHTLLTRTPIFFVRLYFIILCWRSNEPIPQRRKIGNQVPTCRVGIAGDDPKQVKLAKQVIKDICNYHYHEITHPGMSHQEVVRVLINTHYSNTELYRPAVLLGQLL